MAGRVYIGVAGWSYPDWKGIVYTSSKIDQLEYISRFVDCLEINSTFYRPPFEKPQNHGWRKLQNARIFSLQQNCTEALLMKAG